VTVALSGLGGDELFGGYPSFRDLPRLNRLLPFWRRIPAALPLKVAALAVVLPQSKGRFAMLVMKPRQAYFMG
jgi:asparagine synthase (glutamine-hydrolysing)